MDKIKKIIIDYNPFNNDINKNKNIKQNNECDFIYFYTDDEIIINYNRCSNVKQCNFNKNDNKDDKDK
tara:strand:+ start:349 stop:552 length:204 start_codon:yes stop_codon:yes gene_type:complete